MAALQVFAIPELCEMILLQVAYEAAEAHCGYQRKCKCGNECECDEQVHPPEPLTSLAPLHRISSDFNSILKTSPSLQRELYHQTPKHSPSPGASIWWLLNIKIGGIHDGHRKSYPDRGYADICLSVGETKYNDFRYSTAEGRIPDPSQRALQKFLDNKKWASPDASWRKVGLGYSMDFSFSSGRLLPKTTTIPYDSSPPEQEFTETRTLHAHFTLGDVLKCYMEMMKTAVAHREKVESYAARFQSDIDRVSGVSIRQIRPLMITGFLEEAIRRSMDEDEEIVDPVTDEKA